MATHWINYESLTRPMCRCPSLPRKLLRARRNRAKLAPVKMRKSLQGSGDRASRRDFLQRALGLGLTLTAKPAHAAARWSAAVGQRNMIRWQAHEVAKIPAGYQVAVADVNGDGRLDILALSSAKSIVEWYENPTAAHSQHQRSSNQRERAQISLATRSPPGQSPFFDRSWTLTEPLRMTEEL